MIVETIFSTIDEEGNPNFAPMGLICDGKSITVRPYRNTQTCRNLISTGYGIANFTDDVMAFVMCGLYDAILPCFPAHNSPGLIFQEACSWWELSVVEQNGSFDRAEFNCDVLHRGRQKGYAGICRATYAVIEAAIIASRLSWMDSKDVAERLNCFGEIVEKTGGEQHRNAFKLVQEYIQKRGTR